MTTHLQALPYLSSCLPRSKDGCFVPDLGQQVSAVSPPVSSYLIVKCLVGPEGSASCGWQGSLQGAPLAGRLERGAARSMGLPARLPGPPRVTPAPPPRCSPSSMATSSSSRLVGGRVGGSWWEGRAPCGPRLDCWLKARGRRQAELGSG